MEQISTFGEIGASTEPRLLPCGLSDEFFICQLWYLPFLCEKTAAWYLSYLRDSRVIILMKCGYDTATGIQINSSMQEGSAKGNDSENQRK